MIVNDQARTQGRITLDMLAEGPKTAAELRAAGASGTAIARLVAERRILPVVRGVYRLPDLGSGPFETWTAIAKRVPAAVFCLLSAASWHRMTQESAWKVMIAVPRRFGVPRVSGIELGVVQWSSAASYDAGVEVHIVDGAALRITTPTRTVIDLFRMSTLNRRCLPKAARITPEAFLDALQRYLDPNEDKADMADLERLADTFGVTDDILPYVQTAQFALNAAPGRG